MHPGALLQSYLNVLIRIISTGQQSTDQPQELSPTGSQGEFTIDFPHFASALVAAYNQVLEIPFSITQLSGWVASQINVTWGVPVLSCGCDGIEPYTLNFPISGFAFESFEGMEPHVDGQGHAHIYINNPKTPDCWLTENGAKLGRYYGGNFEISKDLINSFGGHYKITVCLFTNMHQGYVKYGTTELYQQTWIVENKQMILDSSVRIKDVKNWCMIDARFTESTTATIEVEMQQDVGPTAGQMATWTGKIICHSSDDLAQLEHANIEIYGVSKSFVHVNLPSVTNLNTTKLWPLETGGQVGQIANGALRGNDCWAYENPQGIRYGLYGYNSGLMIVKWDPTTGDPTTGTESNITLWDGGTNNELSHTASIWGDVKTYIHTDEITNEVRGYCYVSNEQGGGIHCIELTNLDTDATDPFGGVADPSGHHFADEHSTTHNLFVYQSDKVDTSYLYLLGSSGISGDPGIVIYNLSTSTNGIPTEKYIINFEYVHDIQVVDDIPSDWLPSELGGPRLIAFCSTIWEGHVRIYDVTDPSAAILLANVKGMEANFAHQGWLSEDRTLFFVNHEKFTNANSTTGDSQKFYTIDVRKVLQDAQLDNDRVVSAPHITINGNNTVAGVVELGSAIPHNLYTRRKDGRDFIYQSCYSEGIRIWEYRSLNIDEKVHMKIKEVGRYDTSATDTGDVGVDATTNYDGSWSLDIFKDSHDIIVSDVNSGGFIIRFDPPDGVFPVMNDIVNLTQSIDSVDQQQSAGESVFNLHYIVRKLSNA